MQLKNHEIKSFCEFLLDLELPARQTRLRGRFIKMCQDRLNELESGRMALLDRYARRDENGDMVQDENQNIVLNDPNGFFTEFNEMMGEAFIIGELEERMDMLRSVRDSILNIGDDVTFSGQKAIEYDRWCEIVEGIS